jgi:YggT family protein
MAAIASLLVLFLQIYSFVILARVLISWFPNLDYDNPLVQALYAATEPVLAPVRNAMRNTFPDMGPIDLSPIVVFFGITLVQYLIIGIF